MTRLETRENCSQAIQDLSALKSIVDQILILSDDETCMTRDRDRMQSIANGAWKSLFEFIATYPEADIEDIVGQKQVAAQSKLLNALVKGNA